MRIVYFVLSTFVVIFLTAFTPNTDWKASYTDESVFFHQITPAVYLKPATINIPVFVSPVPPPPFIVDMKIISLIESANRKDAHNLGSDARGMFQLRRAAWDDSTKKLGKAYDFDNWTHIRLHSRKVAECYWNVLLPDILKSYKIPITQETMIAAWNYGPTNLREVYRKGRPWIKKLPLETRTYIEQYTNLLELSK